MKMSTSAKFEGAVASRGSRDPAEFTAGRVNQPGVEDSAQCQADDRDHREHDNEPKRSAAAMRAPARLAQMRAPARLAAAMRARPPLAIVCSPAVLAQIRSPAALVATRARPPLAMVCSPAPRPMLRRHPRPRCGRSRRRGAARRPSETGTDPPASRGVWRAVDWTRPGQQDAARMPIAAPPTAHNAAGAELPVARTTEAPSAETDQRAQCTPTPPQTDFGSSASFRTPPMDRLVEANILRAPDGPEPTSLRPRDPPQRGVGAQSTRRDGTQIDQARRRGSSGRVLARAECSSSGCLMARRKYRRQHASGQGVG